ncbi:hypothetical protein IF1G_02439 [Cordyceps javanica]|uniref:Uncharacterized protein n=1 Tax=Cordyceps javanica TaxID=43265 RepID=A0A545V9T2_9HYPO|nr:hypothetical protein IF1G_02439 [Cordyceps javanica]
MKRKTELRSSVKLIRPSCESRPSKTRNEIIFTGHETGCGGPVARVSRRHDIILNCEAAHQKHISGGSGASEPFSKVAEIRGDNGYTFGPSFFFPRLLQRRSLGRGAAGGPNDVGSAPAKVGSTTAISPAVSRPGGSLNATESIRLRYEYDGQVHTRCVLQGPSSVWGTPSSGVSAQASTGRFRWSMGRGAVTVQNYLRARWTVMEPVLPRRPMLSPDHKRRL